MIEMGEMETRRPAKAGAGKIGVSAETAIKKLYLSGKLRSVETRLSFYSHLRKRRVLFELSVPKRNVPPKLTPVKMAFALETCLAEAGFPCELGFFEGRVPKELAGVKTGRCRENSSVEHCIGSKARFVEAGGSRKLDF